MNANMKRWQFGFGTILILVISMFVAIFQIPLIPLANATGGGGAANLINSLLTNVNWTADINTMYDGYSLGEVHASPASGTLMSNLTTLINLISGYNGWKYDNGTANIDEHLAGYQLGNYSTADMNTWASSLWNVTDPSSANSAFLVLYGFAQLMRYSATIPPNQTELKWALDNMAQMYNTIPSRSGGDGPMWMSDRAALYVYYWSQYYSYDLAKWNITQGYANFTSCLDGAGGCHVSLYIGGGGNSYEYWGVNQPRYYDETMQTVAGYLIWYQISVKFGVLNSTAILCRALDCWNWYNNNGGWINDGTKSHYQYHAPPEDGGGWMTSWECSSGSFFELALELEYYYGQVLPNVTRIVTDMYNRYIINGWSSPAWWTGGGAIVHAASYYGNGTGLNSEVRLENTLCAWASLLGGWTNLTSSQQSQLRAMLQGNSSQQPAWELLYTNTGLGLYNTTDGLFREHSTSTGGWGSELYASTQAASLLFMEGIVPVSAVLAIPINEFEYADPTALMDHDLFNLNITSRTVTVSLLSAGNLTFIYGSSNVPYYFGGAGTYNITFASDWNSISSVAFVGSLPTNRVYIAQVTVSISSPTSMTYTSNTITVTFSAIYMGTLDKQWWNVQNGSIWVYASNQTYTGSTSMTGFVSGTYTFYAWVNATDGTLDSDTVGFEVSIPASGGGGAANLINSLLINVNWTADLDTMYAGYSLGLVSLSSLEAQVDALSSSDNLTILYWAKVLEKYGYENQTTIERGLDGVTMSGGLPVTSHYGGYSAYDRYALWGYNWSTAYGYEKGKWNITQGFTNWNSTVYTQGSPILDTAIPTGTNNRFYDECGGTIGSYLIFYQQGISGALNDAEYWWNWTNTNLWVSNTHYEYRPGVDLYECEAGAFYQIVYDLYYCNNATPYMDRLATDAYSRFLASLWSSPQWYYNVVVHATITGDGLSNSERRLENTLTAWAGLQGIFPYLNSAGQAYVRELLNGTAGPDTAYNLLNNSDAKLYNSPANKYVWSSNSPSVTSDSATAYAANLISLMAIVPQSGSLAIPADNLKYEETVSSIDYDLFNFNYVTRQVTVSVIKSGAFQFLYGNTPFTYSLTVGVWDLTLASDWNSITSAVYQGSLPQRVFFINAQPIVPEFPSVTILLPFLMFLLVIIARRKLTRKMKP